MKGDRIFGAVWAALLLSLGLAPLRHGRAPRFWAVALSVVLAATAAFLPGTLHSLNAAWTRLGRILQRFSAPLAAGCLFYLVFTPVGLLLRLFRRDPLRLRMDPAAATYWISRRESGDMRRVF